MGVWTKDGRRGVAHVFHYQGNNRFVTSYFSRVVNVTFDGLCPGLLDTAVILHPRDPWIEPEQPHRPIKLGLQNAILIPFVRYGCCSLGTKQGVSSTAELMALILGSMAVDIHAELGVGHGGLLPADFLRSNRFIECQTSLKAPIDVNRIKTAIDKWIDSAHSILPPGTATAITEPMLHIFGPFPPQYYHCVRTQFERLRQSEIVVDLQTRLVHSPNTNQLCLPVHCPTLAKLAAELDTSIPHLLPNIPQLLPNTTRTNLPRGIDSRVAIVQLDPTASQRLSPLSLAQSILPPIT